MSIFLDAVDEIGCNPEVILVINGKTFSVIPVQTLESSHPKEPSGILKYSADAVIGNIAVGPVYMNEREILFRDFGIQRNRKDKH